MRKKYTYDDVTYIQDNLDIEGFEVCLSIDEEYFKLKFEGIWIFDDSACNDAYDPDTAIALFNDKLSKIEVEPHYWRGVVKAAIGKGFTFTTHTDLDAVVVEAENFLVKETPFEDREYSIVPEFNFRGQSQSLEWRDEDNILCTAQWGEIISSDWRRRSYYRLKDKKLTKAEWFENGDEDVYTYLDTVVTSKGKVVTLIA